MFQRDLTPRHAHYLPFKSMDGELLDEGIALYFRAPHSYTGEDVLELQGHGGPAVLRRVLDSRAAGRDQGLRRPNPASSPAAPSSTTAWTGPGRGRGRPDRRVLGGRARAMASLSGEFSARVNDLSDRIIHLRMLVEATLDFPEEEIDFLKNTRPARRWTRWPPTSAA